MLPEGTMNTEVEMTIDERYKYLRKMRQRYRVAERQARGKLLDEMQAITGLHRKSLIRHMNGSLERKPRKQERQKEYGPDVDAAIGVIARSLDYPSAERLTPKLRSMAEHLAKHGELQVSAAVLKQLAQVSISTVERRLKRWPSDLARRKRIPSRSASSALHGIPMGRIRWDTKEPGHFEADTVHHCGPSASGEYVHTVQIVDVATGWSNRQATLGRSYTVMEHAFDTLLKRLPVAVREIHPDNGSEFFNHHMLRYWKEQVKGVHLSRSRPYHKNDNPLVEERNATFVRSYLGYDRLDTVAQTRMLNLLYDKLWVYGNLFLPMRRTVSKEIVPTPDGGTRIRRRYDRARTPFERLCETGVLSATDRRNLQVLYDRTNPLQLREEIYDLIDQLFALPNAVPGVTEDVYQLVDLPRERQAADQSLVTLSFDG
jgi:hypothetical protein